MTNDYQPYPNVYAAYFLYPLLGLFIMRFDYERLRRAGEAAIRHPIDHYAYFPPKWAYPLVWTCLYMLLSISIFTVYLLAYDMPEWLYFTLHITFYANFFLNKLWVWVFIDFRWYSFAVGFTLALLVLSSLFVTQLMFIDSSWRYLALGFALPLVLWEAFVVIVVGTVASYEASAAEQAANVLAKTEHIDATTSTILDKLSSIASYAPTSLLPSVSLAAVPPTLPATRPSKRLKEFT